jgi:hypothetical protein
MRRNLTEVLGSLAESTVDDIHTALVAKVTRVNATTIDARPVVARVFQGETITLPVFQEVPIYWPSGFAGPVAIGDYCLLIVCESALDNWYAGRDFQAPIEPRTHDYSDSFALCGVRNGAAGVTIPAYPTAYGAQVHLGAATPADAAAVGSRVLAELQALRNTVNAMVGVFNAHVHPILGAVPVVPGVPPTSSASVVPQVVPAVVGAVSSTVVKIPGGVA